MRRLYALLILFLVMGVALGCEAVGDAGPEEEEGGGELIEEAQPKQAESAKKSDAYSADTENKFITVRYRKPDGSVEDVFIQTKAGDLLTALKREGLGTESTAYPGTLAKVGDYTVDEANGQAWTVTLNGEYIDLPPSQVVVNNGDYVLVDLNYY